MFEKFGVLVQAEYLTEKEQELSVRAFTDFYYQLTPKHQKRSKLIWLEGVEPSKIKELQSIIDIPDKAIILGDTSEKSLYLEDASLMLHLCEKHSKVIIPEAFSYGLPIISIDNSSNAEYIDNSCGMLINHKSDEYLVNEATMRLDMLYFDQEVLKFLKRGAFTLYEKKFAWGLREFRRTR